MSVVIEFTQVQKANIKSRNQILGIYEIEFEDINWGEGDCFNSSLFHELFEEANTWGENYFQPPRSKFLFFLLATDYELEIGIKEIEGKEWILAFDPAPLKEFFLDAAKYTQAGEEGAFNNLLSLLDESIEKGFLIHVHYG
jgi:hypothetical protein